MKKYMFLLLLLGVAVLCLFGCGRKAQQDTNQETDTPSTENVFVDTAVVDAQTKLLQYCDGEITMRLNHDETGWHWVDDPSFPLDGEKVEELLAALRELSALPPLSVEADLSVYGLDEPHKYLTMAVENEGNLHLNIGDQAEDGSWYMSVENYEGVYACGDSFVLLLSVSIYDMATLPVFPGFTTENVSRVLVTNSEGQVFLRNVDGQWKGSGEHVTDRIDKVFAGLSALQVGRCFDYLPSQQALHLCGFSDPTATITVEYLNSVNMESSFTLTLGALHSVEEGYYATVNEDTTIYLLPAAQVSPLLTLLIYAN